MGFSQRFASTHAVVVSARAPKIREGTLNPNVKLDPIALCRASTVLGIRDPKIWA